MTIKRIFIIVALITSLGFITVWQQIQIVRQGYQISQLTKIKEEVSNSQRALKFKMTFLKSPQYLLSENEIRQMITPVALTKEEIHKHLHGSDNQEHNISLHDKPR
jgi:hypothetical protein